MDLLRSKQPVQKAVRIKSSSSIEEEIDSEDSLSAGDEIDEEIESPVASP
jgi:hypothetical protein